MGQHVTQLPLVLRELLSAVLINHQLQCWAVILGWLWCWLPCNCGAGHRNSPVGWSNNGSHSPELGSNLRLGAFGFLFKREATKEMLG